MFAPSFWPGRLVEHRDVLHGRPPLGAWGCKLTKLWISVGRLSDTGSPSVVGTPLSHRNIVRSFKGLLKRAGLPVGFRSTVVLDSLVLFVGNFSKWPKVPYLEGTASLRSNLPAFSTRFSTSRMSGSGSKTRIPRPRRRRCVVGAGYAFLSYAQHHEHLLERLV